MGKTPGRKRVRRRKLALPSLGVDVGRALPEAEQRTGRLTMRLTPTERQRLQDVADHYGTTCTNVLMHLVAQAWGAIHRKGGGNG